MTIHPLFIVHTLRPFYVFSDVLDFIEAECSIYQNVQYFIGSKTCVLNFTAVRYSLHKYRETIRGKHDNSSFKCHLFSRVLEFMEARKTCHRVVGSSISSIPYCGEQLQQKLYHQDFRDVDHLKGVLLHCWVR